LAAAPITATAGMTTFFTIQMIDIYGNTEVSSISGTSVTILASYVDHNTWVSPIGVSDITNWVQIYG
jgi:hypothetical protein